MSKVFRIVLAIATLMTTIIMVGLAAFAVSVAKWDVFFVSVMLALSFGILNIIDYEDFFGAGENNGNNTED